MQKKTRPCLFVLVFATSLAVLRKVEADSRLDHLGNDHHHQGSSFRRVKRDSLSATEKREVTDIHNHVRSLEGASDMQTLSYSEIVARFAQEWANKCQWYHGHTKVDPVGTLDYPHMGQNLYAISGAPSINLTNVTLSWYYEKPDYDYDENKCPPEKMCGHYTQVVWADSYEIGCGQATCPFLNQSGFQGEAKLLVCNYGPSGNILERRPFQKGRACSKCSTGQFWCTKGLCNRTCSGNPGDDCHCAANCQNGGSKDDSTCKCKCSRGWGDIDCSRKCQNYDLKCDPAPDELGWPPSWCDHPEFGDTVRRRCLLMCKQCCSGSVNCYQIVLISTSWIVSLLLRVFNVRN